MGTIATHVNLTILNFSTFPDLYLLTIVIKTILGIHIFNKTIWEHKPSLAKSCRTAFFKSCTTILYQISVRYTYLAILVDNIEFTSSSATNRNLTIIFFIIPEFFKCSLHTLNLMILDRNNLTHNLFQNAIRRFRCIIITVEFT